MRKSKKFAVFMVLFVSMIAISYLVSRNIIFPKFGFVDKKDASADKQDKTSIEDKGSNQNNKESDAPQSVVTPTIVPTQKPLVQANNDKKSWYYLSNKNGRKPKSPNGLEDILRENDAYYLSSTDEKIVFLTFDEGYENGYTRKILDVLREKNIKAAFFVTKSYIDKNPDIIRLMVEDGHVVANHSTKHVSMPSKALEKTEFEEELTLCDEAYFSVTGKRISKFFRPPMGDYSELSLSMTKSMGYKTVFWSFAYKDWDVKDQPDPEKALKKIYEQIHPGEIMLLHAVSKTNSEILSDMIDGMTVRGYQFAGLDKLK